jgi:hypothetical protein
MPFANSLGGGRGSAVISVIRVPALDETSLCGNLAEVISYALDEAAFERDELPPFAAHFRDLWTYVGEFRNGLHAAVESNTGRDFEAWRRASQLLGHIGLARYRDILEDFTAFVAANEQLISDFYQDGDGVAAVGLFREFDDRFDEAERGGPDIESVVRGWLMSQSWLSIEKWAPPFMAWLRQTNPTHPLADERKAARLRRRVAENHGVNLALVQRLRQILLGGRSG